MQFSIKASIATKNYKLLQLIIIKAKMQNWPSNFHCFSF